MCVGNKKNEKNNKRLKKMTKNQNDVDECKTWKRMKTKTWWIILGKTSKNIMTSFNGFVVWLDVTHLCLHGPFFMNIIIGINIVMWMNIKKIYLHHNKYNENKYFDMDKCLKKDKD